MSRSAENLPILARFSTLSDLARLRILRLLEQQELSVGELARAVQLPQSTVSRHLKHLLDEAWIARRAAGTASLYRLAPDQLAEPARALWDLTRAQISGGALSTFDEDSHRLESVLAERRTDSREFFGHLGGEWNELRRELFGPMFTGEALLGLLDRRWIVADLGCGTGDAAEMLAPVVKKVIAIDREPAMLDAARRRLGAFRNVEFRPGDLARLPLKAGEVHAAMMLLVLIYCAEPTRVLAECARTIKPGAGGLLVVDLISHDRQSYRHTMGHQHLGFDRKQIEKWAKAAGFRDVSYRRLRPDPSSKGPGLFAAMMRK